jgi:malate dehydrogenase
MQRVAIVGAGELGGAIAHVLARRDAARVITLIDDHARIAEGKSLDIAQAAPIESFAAAMTGTTDLSAAAGADVIVIADRARGGEWQREDGLMLLTRIAQTAPHAVCICAGAAHRELVDIGVREVKMSRTRVFGTAPEALAGGARALAALALDGSPADVALSVLGVPPDHIVIPWQDATMGGFAITRLLNEPMRRRLAAKIVALWPPGPHALAAAVWKAVDVMSGRSRQIASAFVAPDATSGVRARTGAVPVRLGAAGVVDVVVPELSVAERVALENAVML